MATDTPVITSSALISRASTGGDAVVTLRTTERPVFAGSRTRRILATGALVAVAIATAASLLVAAIGMAPGALHDPLAWRGSHGATVSSIHRA